MPVNLGKMETHIKFYLACGALVTMVWGGWQFFDNYNADSLELARVENKSAEDNRQIAVALIATRRDAAAKLLEMDARARAHYQQLADDGELRRAERARKTYLEEVVPERQKEVDKLDTQLMKLEAE